MSSEPPEEPINRAEHNPLSPASPKPIHFPTPTNIPVLDMQMDVGFNQTEAHMNDAGMRNTDVRPDMWRDPNEQEPETTDHASPYSTGGEATMEATETKADGEADGAQPQEQETDSKETASTMETAVLEEPEPVPFPTSTLQNEASGTEVAPPAQPIEAVQTSSDQIVPVVETAPTPLPTQDAFHNQSIRSDQAQPSGASHAFTGSAVDVQSLLDTLQTAPSTASNAAATANTAPQPERMTIATTLSPSSHAQPNPATPQQQALPPGVESSPLSASGLGVPPSGLPPRPPPQEQPLIHPNYVHSQHIRDYHPHASHPAFQPHVRSVSGTQGNVADPTSRNYVPPVHSPSSSGQPSAAPGTSGGNAYGAAPGTSSGNAFGAAAGSNGSNAYPAANASSPTTFPAPGAHSVHAPNGGQPQYAPGTDPQGGPNATYPGGYAGSPQQQWAASPTNMYNPAQQYGSMTNSMPTESPREDGRMSQVSQLRPEDRPWDAEVQRKYDRFIEDERRYVSEGRWEQFPQGSRLFVGKST